ncbi:MAG: hypothetical protein HY343_11745, partial [Lentisphaerae bacterium]|nr:hypothetical protein [Lentisphaerota bacterium]
RYLSSAAFGVPGERLAGAVTSVEAAWGTHVGGREQFEDHGVVAAGALLDAIPESQRTAEVMHAAAAMALHNLPKWAKDLALATNVELPFELLPCANLLALCDELQGWGREPARDPLSYSGRSLKDMRMHVKQGYVEGSHIAAFAVGEHDGKAAVEVTIHYEMAPGEGSAGANLRTDITKWRTNRASDVSRVLRLSDYFALIRIRHLVPDEKPEPEDIYLAGPL